MACTLYAVCVFSYPGITLKSLEEDSVVSIFLKVIRNARDVRGFMFRLDLLIMSEK